MLNMQFMWNARLPGKELVQSMNSIALQMRDKNKWGHGQRVRLEFIFKADWICGWHIRSNKVVPVTLVFEGDQQPPHPSGCNSL